MKLKFRAEGRDVLIFCIFVFVWLIIISFTVVNVSAFLNDDSFTINFFKAFTPNLIAPTMVFFLAGIIAVFAGVKSYFFEREKGIGFETGAKKEKNYSRWAKDKEMKSELKMVRPGDLEAKYAGVPLINNGKEIWVDNGPYHSLIIGSTGSGKTEMIVQPMVKVLAKAGESMIITDPKGEIYEKNALELRERGYNIVLLNFRDPQQGNCWNPMSLPYNLYKSGNSDKAIELLDDLAKNILYDESSKGQDPFWENTSADYFSGLSLGLFEDAKEEEINLNSINLMTTVGEEKIANTTYIKDYFSYKDPSSPAYINASSTLMAPSETKGSILSVFKQKIKLFSSRENLSEMLSKSDFDIEDIGRKKTAVFIVIQDEKKTYHPLVTIFLKQVYETLIRVAQENGGALPYRTNFILDEFANMPPLKDVTTMVTAARSRKIRFTFIIQNFAQLNEVYGKENAETIKGNCGNIIYLISSELAALEEISKMCGEVKSKEKEKTSSTPLVTVSDLQRLKVGTIIVLRIRMMPFKTKMKMNWQMLKEGLWGKTYEKASYPQREKGTVQLFDVKSFVDKKREDKINNLLGKSVDKPLSNGMSTPLNSEPFKTSMPFSGFPAFPSSSNAESSPKKDSAPAFDVDALVRKIDAKIAELEEEERKEKENETATENQVQSTNSSSTPIMDNSNKFENVKIEPKNISIPDLREKNDDNINNQVNKSSNVEIRPNNSSHINNNNMISDDQFFDDFFGDE